VTPDSEADPGCQPDSDTEVDANLNLEQTRRPGLTVTNTVTAAGHIAGTRCRARSDGVIMNPQVHESYSESSGLPLT
jgi:hypothetical protein